MADPVSRCRAASWLLGPVASLALLFGFAAHATTPGSSAAPFVHSSWPVARGAPADIWALAQDGDGYLWLGTGSGLYKFDGKTFHLFRGEDSDNTTSNNITALRAAPNGDLWIGYYLGGVARLRHGELTHFKETSSLADGWVTAIRVDADGIVWAAAIGGLLRFDGKKWALVGQDWGFNSDHAGWVELAPDGTLWATGSSKLYFLPRRSRHFEATTIPLRRQSIVAISPQGTVWVSDREAGLRALPGVSRARPQGNPILPRASKTSVKADRIMFDRQGRMWGTDMQHRSLFTIDSPDRQPSGQLLEAEQTSAQFDSRDGMASDQMTPILQDREGTIWVGTNFGLDSFRSANVTTIDGLSRSERVRYMADSGSDGALWVSSGSALFKVTGSQANKVLNFDSRIQIVRAVSESTIWVRTIDQLVRVDNGTATFIPIPMAAEWRTFTADHDGGKGLWVGVNGRGYFHFDGSSWKELATGRRPPKDVHVSTASVSTEGVVWFAGDDNRITKIDGRTDDFQSLEVDGIGPIYSLSNDGALKLAGGEKGLALLGEDGYAVLNSLGLISLAGVTGIGQRDGNIWLNTSQGVVLVSSDELTRTFAQKSHVPKARLFDFHDGLPGIALQSNDRTLGFNEIGNVWIASNQGPALIDPRRIKRNEVSPGVFIKSLTTDAKTYPATGLLQLPAGTSRAHIEFTATSLTVPERVSFRYRLSGIDKEWQEAGARREAFYTNLSPGHYEFQVRASNEDGLWSKDEANLKFDVAPLFYQTSWFLLLSVLSALLILFLFLLDRMRRYSNRLRIQIEAKHSERERIARDLHDTLLQSVQSLTLRFGTALDGLSPDDPTRENLSKALDVAENVIGEGRDRLLSLRSETNESLYEILRIVGRESESLYGIPFSIEIEGSVTTLTQEVNDEMLAILREAILNAFQHAKASVVRCKLCYRPKHLTGTVIDDGAGLKQDLYMSGEDQRHFGLRGMRERARKIRAHFVISGTEGGGTTVLVRVRTGLNFKSRILRYVPGSLKYESL